MRIAVFGLGYVGVVSAGILADQDNIIIGVDVNQKKIDMLNKGISPIVEAKVPEIIKKVVKSKNLRATADTREAILMSDVSIVCVGTPSNRNGSAKLAFIERVMKDIAEVLKEKQEKHVVILRSTVPPGTMEDLVMPIFKEMDWVSFCYNPEFLREGSSIDDYYAPPYTVVACSDKHSLQTMKKYYSPIEAEFIETDFRTAESIKMINNVFHAYKVVFANEVKRFSEPYGLDANKIMDIVCKDKKQNISPMYLKPGFAFGGSCLPKDLRSMKYMSKIKDVKIPVINNIEESNSEHLKGAIELIKSQKKKSIGFIGLSFKSGTDDLRESPYVELVEFCIGKGYKVMIYDPLVNHEKLLGANKAFIEKEIPHVSKLLKDNLKEVFKCDIIVQNHDINIKRYLKDKHIHIDLR